jgi:signal transduction histidine kinase/AraC-like DNA-binding protein/ABC-type sugar transport system substrate-binding protein/FixJ family two-component response regulator
MARTVQIVAQFSAADPFWVLVRERVYQLGLQHGINVFPIDIEQPYDLSDFECLSLVEELLALEIDAVISQDCPVSLAQRVLESGIPIVNLTESDFRHPLFASPVGLYEVAKNIGLYLAERLNGRGRVLAVGGGVHHRGEDGRSRVAGIHTALENYPHISLVYLPSLWTYEEAYRQIQQQSWQPDEHFDVVFGLSDSIALAGIDACHELGLIDEHSLIVGINGDPLALEAIVNGRMTATVQTSTTDFAEQVVSLAIQAAQKQPFPEHFGFKPIFVTAQNVSEIAAQKLVAIAGIPSRLIGDNIRQSQLRLAQLETSLKINQQVGMLLDRRQLLHAIANLIRVSYGYDVVRTFTWDEAEQALVLEISNETPSQRRINLDEAGILAEAIQGREAIYIADAQHSHRYPPDEKWPETRSRVIVPVRLAGRTLGLLDLHSHTLQQHARQDLIGLQSLADQLGIALSNAELYSEAVRARAIAEKADQIKSRLLANVSHELRTPLNVIMGYASAAMTAPSPYKSELPPELLNDLKYIYDSGEHLLRVINDLLDLSRAEINELDLFPETIEPGAFLAEVFNGMAQNSLSHPEVHWRLQLPERLPVIQADPIRLRQILLNLLSNADKFTSRGEIVLGAEVAPPHLHFWVQDSGAGINAELQEHIFEPFANSRQARQLREGIGLGLSITRRLVMLHGGSITFESRPGIGSTFHVYMPLPTLSGRTMIIPENAQPVVFFISSHVSPPTALHDLSERRGWELRALDSQADLSTLFSEMRPAALAWDLANASLSDWTLIQSIRSYPQLTTLPFILYSDEEQVASESNFGLTNFLVKPLSQKTLMDTINGLRSTVEHGQVLVVEDDPQARDLYTRLAAHALPEYSIYTVESGEAALDYLSRETPVLVIMHLMLPDIDGFTLLEQMRSQPATQRVPVVLLSGRTLSFDDVRRLDHMYVTYHSKQLLTELEAAEAFHRAIIDENALPAQTSLVVKQAIAYLQERFSQAVTRQDLAAAVGVSKDYLSHIFHQEVGFSTWEYLLRYRIQQAKTRLRNCNNSIMEIAAQVGFNDLSYFYRVFRKNVGCTPREYREGSQDKSHFLKHP